MVRGAQGRAGVRVSAAAKEECCGEGSEGEGEGGWCGDGRDGRCSWTDHEAVEWVEEEAVSRQGS